MRLLFFQNCVSPHQMPYIEVLSRRDDVEHVWVIAPRLAYSDRAAMGWPETWTTSSEKLSILINPKDEDVEGLFNSSFCFFSGISAFPEVHHWFLLSLGFDVKRGIITEAPYTYDKPLWMHKVRFALKDWRYVSRVDYVFAIGENCAKYYNAWNKKWKVVPFMYCTEMAKGERRQKANDERLMTKGKGLRVCFVGALDRRKNVSVLMKALSMLDTQEESADALPENRAYLVTIVGDGPERTMLEDMARSLDGNVSVTFVGAKPMEETQSIIAENDVLVLPSLHDGWGAVINEAMTLGTVPVCSDRCGAKYIIEKSGFGGVFDVDEPHMLAEMLQQYADNIDDLRTERSSRIAWAEKNISPKAVADYFISSLSNQ